MTYSKTVATAFVLLAVLAGCSTSGANRPNADKADPRYATLLNMDLSEFYGTLAIAGTVGRECPGIVRNSRIDLQLNEARNERGNGSFAALTQRQAIKDAQNSMSQGFKDSHGEDMCGVAIRDFQDAEKPYTFFLMGETQG